MRLATLWALVGDTAQTFHWLDRAYAERNPGLIFDITDVRCRALAFAR